MANEFDNAAYKHVTQPGRGVFACVQSDSVDLVQQARNLWFLADGAVSLVFDDDSVLTAWPVVAGTALPNGMFVKRVLDTGTDLADAEIICIK
jgi:hypothetical protein